MLVGRDVERARLEQLLDQAAAGHGGALVVRGEAGIGKTALLHYARERAGEATVVSTSGIESEAELSFAGLADVVRPLLDHLDALPDSQADVVQAALALGPPRAIDRLTIGAATLALLAAASAEVALVVLVDDAHWLDAASRDALVFAGRRLAADPVALLFAARDGEPVVFEPAGIEEVELDGLGRDDAAALLGPDVPPAGVELLFELTHGNPLALLELPGSLTEAQLRGREPVEHPVRVGSPIERSFARRALLLGETGRRALIVAAADDSGDLDVVQAAVRRLDPGHDELARAEEAGLLQLDGARIEFRHPLVRAALYQGAAPSERREAHAALAAVLEGRDEPRRAWHAAAAAVGHDAAAAEALAAVAAESHARGAYAAAAAAFERAARLTPDAERRTALLARAADAAWLAGQTGRTAALVAEGLSSAASDRSRAEVLALRGRVAMHNDEQDVAHDTLLEAAQLVEGDDPGRAAELLSEAIGPAVQLGARAVARVAVRLRALPLDTNPLRELDVAQALLWAASVAGDPENEQRALVQVLTAAETAGALDTSALHVLGAARARFMLGHNDEAARLARRALDRARQDGAMALVVQALRLLADADFDRGRWQTAYAAAGEAIDLGHELEQRSSVCQCLGLLADIDAGRGDEAACRQRAAEAIEIAQSIGLSLHRERAERALGRLQLATGNALAAIEQLERVNSRLERSGNREMNVTPAWDLVEAYARIGEIAKARTQLARAEVAMPPISPAEEVPIQRCRGIVAEDGTFETAFERALVLDDEQPFPFERARTALAYGERLRRAGAPKRAREQLRAALAAFEEIGATAWAVRARSELAASGERLRRAPVSRENLTPRELQVALAVAEGASNAEVAAALYLTPKTVEYHLTHVYRKLGLRSRTELANRFARGS